MSGENLRLIYIHWLSGRRTDGIPLLYQEHYVFILLKLTSNSANQIKSITDYNIQLSQQTIFYSGHMKI
jgi:hypothetical protein